MLCDVCRSALILFPGASRKLNEEFAGLFLLVSFSAGNELNFYLVISAVAKSFALIHGWLDSGQKEVLFFTEHSYFFIKLRILTFMLKVEVCEYNCKEIFPAVTTLWHSD